MEHLESVSSEVTALRADMDARFAAVRANMGALRSEMNQQFAVRADMDAKFVALRTDMDAGLVVFRAEIDVLRRDGNARSALAEMDAGISTLRLDMHALRVDMNARFAVRADTETAFDAVHQTLISLHTQIDDLHRQMLVLHEELISRIKTLGEVWRSGPPGPRKKR